MNEQTIAANLAEKQPRLSSEKKEVIPQKTEVMLIGPYVDQKVLGADKATFFLNFLLVKLNRLYRDAYFLNIATIVESEQCGVLIPGRLVDKDPLNSVFAGGISKKREYPDGLNLFGTYILPPDASIAAEFFPQDIVLVGNTGRQVYVTENMADSVRLSLVSNEEISDQTDCLVSEKLGEGGRFSHGDRIVFHNLDLSPSEMAQLQELYPDKQLVQISDASTLLGKYLEPTMQKLQADLASSLEDRVNDDFEKDLERDLQDTTIGVLIGWLNHTFDPIDWTIAAGVSEEDRFRMANVLRDSHSRNEQQFQIKQWIRERIVIFDDELWKEASTTASMTIKGWARNKIERADNKVLQNMQREAKRDFLDPHRATTVRHIDQIIGSDFFLSANGAVIVPISQRYLSLLSASEVQVTKELVDGTPMQYLPIRSEIMDAVDLLNYPTSRSGKKYLGPLMAMLLATYIQGGLSEVDRFQQQLINSMKNISDATSFEETKRAVLNDRISESDKERMTQMDRCIQMNQWLALHYAQWQADAQQALSKAELDLCVLPYEVPVHELQKGGLKCKTNFL